MADDRRKLNYLEHLVDRYQEFKAWDCTQAGVPMRYPAIRAAFKAEFGMPVRHMPLHRFEEAAQYLQKRIRNTKLGRINAAKGVALYCEFEEFDG